jgi:ribose 5-phosphate isomerase A
MTPDEQKMAAAEKATEFVENGMKLGLGTGSTAAKFVDLVGRKVADGLEIICVPTSEATRIQAEALGIPLTTLDETPHLDLTVDGADELDDKLRLIKGGGGALLREKIVATASDKMLVIADASKHVATLGAFDLPVEVEKFGLKSTENMVEAAIKHANCSGGMRLRCQNDGTEFVTDGGNYILDCALGNIPDPEKLALELAVVPGVVESGLFINIASAAIVAGDAGITMLEKV